MQLPSEGGAVFRAVHAMSKSMSVLAGAGSPTSQGVMSLSVDSMARVAVQYVFVGVWVCVGGGWVGRGTGTLPDPFVVLYNALCMPLSRWPLRRAESADSTEL
jgi:hypothetical protein